MCNAWWRWPQSKGVCLALWPRKNYALLIKSPGLVFFCTFTVFPVFLRPPLILFRAKVVIFFYCCYFCCYFCCVCLRAGGGFLVQEHISVGCFVDCKNNRLVASFSTFAFLACFNFFFVIIESLPVLDILLLCCLLCYLARSAEFHAFYVCFFLRLNLDMYFVAIVHCCYVADVFITLVTVVMTTLAQ